MAAKMVKKQCAFPPPASSAGVERIFSAAGKMHLKKSAKDTTLEHSLFAAFNAD